MENEVYRQSRKPITDQDLNKPVTAQDVNNVDPQDAFKSAQELKEKTRKEAPIQSNDHLNIEGPIPPAFQAALKAKTRGEKVENKIQDPSPIYKYESEKDWDAIVAKQGGVTLDASNYGSVVGKPRLATTNNPKLNELLAGIKQTISQYEEITLPSKGKFYDGDDCPEGGVIHVRPMTGDEEAILSTTRFIRKGQAMDMIFRNCVQEAVKPERWLIVDRNYLLIYLRGISYGHEYEIEARCPNCSNKFPTEINLDRLFLNFCPETFGPPDLVGTLPVTKYKFSYRLQTATDDKLITEHRERRARTLGDTALDDTNAYRLALLVNDIEGLTDKQALFTLISRLPIGDITHLRNLVNEPPFGVDTKWGLSCPSCAENFEVEMPYESNFFFPRPKKADRTQV